MTEKVQEKIVAFDTLFTTNQIQTLKILLTYMEPSQQKNLAVYIKFLELQYTISFFKLHPSCSLGYSDLPKGANFTNLCEELLPLCPPSEQEKIVQMKNMMQTFENMQEMMQMVHMMQEMFPEGENPFNGDPSSILSGLSGMSGSDPMDLSQLSQLFEMFQNK